MLSKRTAALETTMTSPSLPVEDKQRIWADESGSSKKLLQKFRIQLSKPLRLIASPTPQSPPQSTQTLQRGTGVAIPLKMLRTGWQQTVA